MKTVRRGNPLLLLLFAGVLWVVFLTLMTLCFRWLGTTFPWVVLTSLVAAWGVWTIVIARSHRHPRMEQERTRAASPIVAGSPDAKVVAFKAG